MNLQKILNDLAICNDRNEVKQVLRCNRNNYDLWIALTKTTKEYDKLKIIKSPMNK